MLAFGTPRHEILTKVNKVVRTRVMNVGVASLVGVGVGDEGVGGRRC